MGEHRWRAALRAVLGPILGIGLGLGCGSRDRAAAVDRAACERLRAHLVELRLGGANQYMWQSLSDLIDLDGDGLAESVSWNGVNMQRSGQVAAGAPPRLLTSVKNGRGLTTSIVYAPFSDAGTVNNDPWNGTASPRTEWVVKSITVHDDFEAPDSTTTYFYNDPWYGADDEGRYAFRGFLETKATGPRGKVTIDRYSFTPDWSGRLVASVVQHQGGAVHSITETTWTELSLFSGALKTYHPTSVRIWACASAATETSCKASPAGFTRTVSTWTALASTTASPPGPARLYAETTKTLQDSEAFDDGDRKSVTTFALHADGSSYRLRDERKEQFVRTGGVDQRYRSSSKTWDAEHKQLNLESVVLDATTTATTQYEYLPSGVPISVRKPEQYAVAGAKSIATYDAKQLFPIAKTNELGHASETDFEYGTGAVLEERGPNFRNCATPQGCPTDPALPVRDGKRIKVDGLGRPLEVEVTTFLPGYVQAYAWAKVEKNVYTDAASGSQPPKILQQKLIQYNATRWTSLRTDLDGHGRPVKAVESVNGTAPNDAITTYDYDSDGTLVAVTVPDPSTNSSAVVGFTYTYDTLGRPTGIRRPDATVSTDRSGIDLAYNGLVETRTEVPGVAGVGAAGAAKTELVKDAFGRLVKVREYTTAAQVAETTYAFSPADEVKSIVDPNGITTLLDHDMGGRRTQITRGTRIWKYRYDRDNNLTRVIAPFVAPPGQEAAEELLYTTSYAYDALDRVTSKLPAPRHTPGADLDLFGSFQAVYTWDSGTFNRVGRLVFYETKTRTGTTVFKSRRYYDPEGQTRIEDRQWDVPISAGTFSLPFRGESYHYDPFAKLERVSFADAVDGGEANSNAHIDYDDRGNALQLVLQRPAMADKAVGVQTRNVAGLVTKRRTTQTGTGITTLIESNWTYDKLGRVTQQLVQKTGSVRVAEQDLTYFGNDDPKTLDHWIGTTNHKRFTFTYDKRHQLKGSTESAAGGALTTSYQYLADGRFDTATVTPTALPGREARSRNVRYVYSATDPEQVAELRTPSGSTTVPYAGYAYDPSGNQTSRTYWTNNALPPANLASAETYTFEYDGDDQLRRVTTPGGAGTIEEYWYDSEGRRALVRTRASNGSGPTTWRWFHNSTEVEFQTAQATPLSPTLVKTLGYASLGTPVAVVQDRNDRTELQFHGLASSMLATVESGIGVLEAGDPAPPASGSTNAAFMYTPFGEVIETSGTEVAIHRRRMNDKYQDASTGLSYYGYRYYDPVAMVWTQADPQYRVMPDAAWDEPRRAGLYLFSSQNPLRYLDPDGRQADPWPMIDAPGTPTEDLVDPHEIALPSSVADALEAAGIALAIATGTGLLVGTVALLVGADVAVATAVGVKAAEITGTALAAGAAPGEGGGLMAVGCTAKATSAKATLEAGGKAGAGVVADAVADAAGGAAARGIPQIARASNLEMLGQALNHLKKGL